MYFVVEGEFEAWNVEDNKVLAKVKFACDSLLVMVPVSSGKENIWAKSLCSLTSQLVELLLSRRKSTVKSCP